MNNYSETSPEVREALTAAQAFAVPARPIIEQANLAERAGEDVIDRIPEPGSDIETMIADVLEIGAMLKKHRDDYDLAA